MKKLSYVLSVFGTIVPNVTLAAIEKLENPTNVPTLYDFIKAVLTIVVKIGIPIATVFIIWSGFLFLTAQGDEAQLKKAKQSFVWACVGTAVLLGAWLLATAIKSTIDQL
jgi:hypothetical protein